MKLIVADASPLIVLARSSLIEVLTKVAGEVAVPETVFAECTVDIERPGAKGILDAQARALLTLHPDPPIRVLAHGAPIPDAGELAAILLARQLACPVLIDERLGRLVAELHGVPVLGSAGILLKAKQRNLIPAVAPILNDWITNGYFLSPAFIRLILTRAGEDCPPQ